MHRFSSLKKIKSAVLLGAILLLINPTNIFAYTNIKVNADNKTIVAPNASKYQWFYNDVVIMGAIERAYSPSKSGKYTVQVTDEEGGISTQSVSVAVSANAITKIFVVGDSTVSSYSDNYYPQKGWGQMLHLFLDGSKFQIENRARGGRSSRGFIEEGLWNNVIAELSAGDYVFVQFGHNDRDPKPSRYTTPVDFKIYMKQYVDSSRAKGAIPVLISPMVMNAWKGATMRNVFTESGADYRGAMLEVAQDLNVPFIDLNMKSWNFFKQYNWDYNARFFFLQLDDDEYPNSKGYRTDGLTHFHEMGALKMALFVSEGIQELDTVAEISSLADALNPLYNVNIAAGNPDAGAFTKTSKFPKGAKVTLKARLNIGTEVIWEDDSLGVLGQDLRTSLIVDTMDYNITVSAVDCKGKIGGSAYYDKCNTCIDEDSGMVACTRAIESEKACVYDGSVRIANENGNSVKFVKMELGDSSVLGYSLGVSTTGNFDFGIKYKGNASSQIVDILINGEETVKGLELEASEDLWSLKNFNIDIERGIKSLEILFPDLDQDIYIDMVASYSAYVNISTNCGALSTEKLNRNNVEVYPNPFNNELGIYASNAVNYKIFNNSGILMEQGLCDGQCMVGNDLLNGIYFLQIINGNQVLSKTINKL